MVVPRLQTMANERSNLNCSMLQIPDAAKASVTGDAMFACGSESVPHGDTCCFGCSSSSSKGWIHINATCHNGTWRLPGNVSWEHLGCLGSTLSTMAPTLERRLNASDGSSALLPNNFSAAATQSSQTVTGEGINEGGVFAVVLVILLIPAIAVAVAVYLQQKKLAEMEEEEKSTSKYTELMEISEVAREKSTKKVMQSSDAENREVSKTSSSNQMQSTGSRDERSLQLERLPSPPQNVVNGAQPPGIPGPIPGQILDDVEVQSEGGSSAAPSLPAQPKDEVEV
eukprot:gnl/MRDRNA2_/MRDRNA2_64357_c0_seq1.p1 gnl/MRDRNA2_/MRDRNA2_64357_c0~~gnl/MRDRNA2_/MRDRNA2_64357_c0_seq1.p1  ORF type:complete len:296 (-),score=50.89 gnl/MRDRNA2_/MRDRNA2_64357_c0_seq1:37-888(-)